jgi:hypothetical protein
MTLSYLMHGQLSHVPQQSRARQCDNLQRSLLGKANEGLITCRHLLHIPIADAVRRQDKICVSCADRVQRKLVWFPYQGNKQTREYHAQNASIVSSPFEPTHPLGGLQRDQTDFVVRILVQSRLDRAVNFHAHLRHLNRYHYSM